MAKALFGNNAVRRNMAAEVNLPILVKKNEPTQVGSNFYNGRSSCLITKSTQNPAAQNTQQSQAAAKQCRT